MAANHRYDKKSPGLLLLNWLAKLFSVVLSIGKSPITITIIMQKIYDIDIVGKHDVFASTIDPASLTIRTSRMSQIAITSLQTENLNQKIVSRSKFIGVGQATNFSIAEGGYGDCQAEKMANRRATGKIGGHCNVKNWVKEDLDISNGGFSKARLRRMPLNIQKISYPGNVSPLE